MLPTWRKSCGWGIGRYSFWKGGAQRRDLEILDIKALFMHQSLLHEVNLTTVLLPIPTLKNL
jgi:hypothetical protein